MKRFELLFMALYVPVDFLMIFFAAVCAYMLRVSDWAVSYRPVFFDITFIEYLQLAFWVIPFWLIIFALNGLYTPNANRRFAEDIKRIFLAVTAGLALIAIVIMFRQQLFESRFLALVTTLFSFFFVVLGRLLLRGLKGIMYRFGYGLRRIALIGKGDIAKQLEEELARRKELGYRVVFRAQTWNKANQEKMLELSIDEMLLADARMDEATTLEIFDFALAHHIGFKYSADLFATITANMSVHPLAGVPIVEMKRARLEGWGRIQKRVFDIVVSLFVLLLVSPLLLITAIIIWAETGRPLLYKNERVGVRGKSFIALKFRSMYQKDSTGAQFGVSGEEALKKEQQLIKKQNSKQGPIYKIVNDPRVTPFGRFIRRFSIDEFPQFLNVLQGEMSIVGPRPHQPREVEGYEKKHHIVFDVKPGITGLAQISGRSDLSFDEEMRLDALYVEKWSLWLDVIIFVKTPFILFKKRTVE